MTALALKAFLTLLFVIDPVGLVPVFLSLAGTRPPAEQARIARKSVLVSAGLIASFGIGGAWLLHHLSISFDAFRVAGGILLFLIAVDMVLAKLERETQEEEREARARTDISVFPLAIPMISGPGTLASVMILAAEARGVEYGLPIVLATGGGVLLLCFASLQLATPIGKLLGQTGVNVVTRVLGVLLAALAVQYVADGVKGLLA